MSNDNYKTPVGNCYHCGKNAQWNSPALDTHNNLWCDRCKDEDRNDIFFRTVNQYKENEEFVLDGGVALNGVIVWKDKSTWVDGGSRAVKLTDKEKDLSPKDIAILIDNEHNKLKLTRCTGCGNKMKEPEIAGYPLFAGVSCPSCWEKHKEFLNEQRKKGHVCYRCREPYGNCCC